MKKGSILLLFSLNFIFTQCDSKSKEEIEKRTEQEEIAETKDLILGKWVFMDEESGVEFWMFLDENKVYSDGLEEGLEYRIENNVMITTAYGTESYTVIVSVDEEQLVLDTDGSIVTWTKSL